MRAAARLRGQRPPHSPVSDKRPPRRADAEGINLPESPFGEEAAEVDKMMEEEEKAADKVRRREGSWLAVPS